MIGFLILVVGCLILLGYLWIVFFGGDEKLAEWFPIVDFIMDPIVQIPDNFESAFWGNCLFLLAYCAAVIVPLLMIFFGWFMAMGDEGAWLPPILNVLGGILMAVGWNQSGSPETALYVIAGLMVLIGLITGIAKGGFIFGFFGTLLLQGGLLLLPVSVIFFSGILYIAITILVIMAIIAAIKGIFSNCDFIIFWRR